jgi:hypothetical protein
MSCADAGVPSEPKGETTAKLLKAHASTNLPASNTDDFVAAQGGTPIDIDGWEGYVAGTTADALFEMHFSGLHGTRAVGGLSLAFVDQGGAASTGDLATRLASVPRLEVRFHDGSGLVSSHTFTADGSEGVTDPAHQSDPTSDALLKRAFSDSEALLRLPTDQVGGGDKASACMASFLAAVSGAARCVDDAGNADDCTAVRNEAVLVAASCNGPKTANVLQGHGSITPQALPGGGLGGLGSIFKLLGSFALKSGKGGGAGGLLGSFASILGGGGGAKGFGGLLGGLLSVEKLFGKSGGLSKGLLSGAGSGFDSGAFGGSGFGSDLFGNENMSIGDLGDVTGESLFE